MKPRILLSPPHMGGSELKYVQQAFEQNWIVPLGPNVDAFENELGEIDRDRPRGCAVIRNRSPTPGTDTAGRETRGLCHRVFLHFFSYN